CDHNMVETLEKLWVHQRVAAHPELYAFLFALRAQALYIRQQTVGICLDVLKQRGQPGIAEGSTDLIFLLEDRDLVRFSHQRGIGQTRWSRADHRNALTVAARRPVR